MIRSDSLFFLHPHLTNKSSKQTQHFFLYFKPIHQTIITMAGDCGCSGASCNCGSSCSCSGCGK
ncbi:hypothetical protein H9L39_10649 [Fusarium oxysporum f. sp. albedinis]|nr:hypothetical protein H9L39_10649 [Fusarium oxysporum f. sp. albedinis]